MSPKRVGIYRCGVNVYQKRVIVDPRRVSDYPSSISMDRKRVIPNWISILGASLGGTAAKNSYVDTIHQMFCLFLCLPAASVEVTWLDARELPGMILFDIDLLESAVGSSAFRCICNSFLRCGDTRSNPCGNNQKS